jgi:transglutaminase-like putative cysteine protease
MLRLNMTSATRPLTVRCGLEFAYQAADPTHIVLLIQPRLEPGQAMEGEQLEFSPGVEVEEYQDVHHNLVRRFELPAGRTYIRHDAFVTLSSLPENQDIKDGVLPVGELTAELLRYTLPSRYCDSDRLMDFAYQQFGQIPHGLRRVQAICDWVHEKIEYRWGSGSPYTSASEVLAQRFGICRDFAHVAIALCRCFNLPARYVTGHLPDIACLDSGAAMDFHAYFQVYFGHRWNTFDARFNTARIGRIHIACGFDAVECAFSTLYGAANLTWFNVWNYQVDPAVVKLGDPVDLAHRLDGTPELRFPTGVARSVPVA